ncbi:MAG TPA: sigma-70 family RNA polymerase sigma factor [Puia sp.]|nr:sigma-70 family RNA polymerase sigma factor [Puia sp.]
MEEQNLIPHLFRTEYRKIVSVLYRHFGFEQMETAEDIASDTFLAAAQTWGIEGPPKNPAAWLYHVARNKAKTFLQRDQVFRLKVTPAVKAAASLATGNGTPGAPGQVMDTEIDLSPASIEDSQLQMMFAICTPLIPAESQVGLSLRILCGFGIEEIADAFLTNKETINKRLFRAREKLREAGIRIEMPAASELDHRLPAVLTTIYLLFNEGYYSESSDAVLRKDLCIEAIRLCHMLSDNPVTCTPAVDALLALMCFHASRFEARIDRHGDIVLYADQDTNRWNTDLIAKGIDYLHRAARGNTITKYHLEAGIAYWSTQKEDTAEKWEQILQYYNLLLQLEYSPIAALNRIYALAKARGKKEAIVQAEKLQLTDNPFYFALLGELYTDIDNSKAIGHFGQAMALARTAADRQLMQNKIARL